MYPTADLLKAVNEGKHDINHSHLICFNLPIMVRSALESIEGMHYYSYTHSKDPNECDMIVISVPGTINQEVYNVLADIHIGELVGNFNLQEINHRQEPEEHKPLENDMHI